MRAALIYMASGFGSRFGANKLTQELEGRPLYRHGLDCLLGAKAQLANGGWEVRLIVVSQYEEILGEAARLGAETVQNLQAGEGITASIRLGTQKAGEEAELLVYCVADEPRLRQETVAGFLTGFADSGCGMGCVFDGKRKGNPAAFAARYREQLLELTGDRGGSQLMKRYPEDVWLYRAAEEELKDVDLPGDLENMGQ